MSDQPTTTDEPSRRQIFAALVGAQDKGLSVTKSREAVAKQFGVTPAEVSAIEREGLTQQWPPL